MCHTLRHLMDTLHVPLLKIEINQKLNRFSSIVLYINMFHMFHSYFKKVMVHYVFDQESAHHQGWIQDFQSGGGGGGGGGAPMNTEGASFLGGVFENLSLQNGHFQHFDPPPPPLDPPLIILQQNIWQKFGGGHLLC